ncbi:unnamed protein product [Closterium sp. NIES-54]
MEGAQILGFFDDSLPYPTHGTQYDKQQYTYQSLMAYTILLQNITANEQHNIRPVSLGEWSRVRIRVYAHAGRCRCAEPVSLGVVGILTSSRDNSSSINTGSSIDNSSSSDTDRSRSNNNSTSTNRHLFISTNSHHRDHTDSHSTADSRRTRSSQKHQNHRNFLL